jgi:Tol biopolymer transport system component
MTLSPGTRLGSYEISAPLGAGGMGEVYRARDVKLGRDVAVKVLPEALAADGEALARFESEARAVAALSHPHILAIHDFGRENGTTYAVMELLEGATLRQKLLEGPLPVRKAVELAREIAQALAAAHEKGIVHRDLKPENLFVTKGGRVKVLDFGLARQIAVPTATADTASPTVARRTEPGAVLGTVGYMSPEQVKGQPADARSDIFSFGAVLFEMLSGRRAFERATAVETMTAILREDPPEATTTGVHVPLALERVIRHCLEKEPEERFRTAHDLAFALEAAGGSSSSSSGAAAVPEARRSRALVLAAGALLCAVAGGAIVLLAGRTPPPGLVAVKPLTHSGADFEPAASPDGRAIAFTSTRDGTSRIWLKQLATGDEVAVTSGPDSVPRFSPDGTQILFLRGPRARRIALGFSETQTDLFRAPILGGGARRIATLADDADWSPDGKSIAFLRMKLVDGKIVSSLLLVSPEGGEPKEIARWPGRAAGTPRFRPDGKTIAVPIGALTGATNTRIEIVPTDAGSTREIVPPPPVYGAVSSTEWSRDGRSLRYIQALLATFGASRLVRQDVRSGASTALLWLPFETVVLDVLPDGRLLADSRESRENLLEYTLDTPGAVPRWLTRGTSADRQPVFSPDGERIAFSSNRNGNLDIWELTAATGALRRLTEDETDDWDPGYTKDGRLLWTSGRSGHFEIWTAEPDGASPKRVSDDGVDAENPTVTPDGWVVYVSVNPQKQGLWKVRLDGSSAARVGDGQALSEVSPDGAFTASPDANVGPLRFYRLADGARLPLTIDTAPRRATEVQLGRPRWSRDGRKIYFLAQDEKGVNGIYEQAFDAQAKDTSATRKKVAGFDPSFETESFGISPDGKRIVIAALERTYGIVAIEGFGEKRAPPR